MTATLAQTAANPKTPLEALADLAYQHPELRAAVAANPSTYPDLLEWLGELGDPEVDAALRRRAGHLTDEERAADPDTDAAVLAELAYQHPELRETIATNPSAYDGLREWIEQAGSTPAPALATESAIAPLAQGPKPSGLARLNAKFGPTFTLDTLVLLIVIAYASVLSLVMGGVVVSTLGNFISPLISAAVSDIGDTAFSQSDLSNEGSSTTPGRPYWDSTQTVRVADQPSSLPGCPLGSSVMAWTEWPGGGILECRFDSNDRGIVLLVSGSDVSEGTIEFTTTSGLRATVDGRDLEISLSGWLVVDDGTVQPARSGWIFRTGMFSYTPPPQNLATCPSNTVSTSLSTWEGGWLLTCGTVGDDMSAFRYSAGGQSGSGGEMTRSGSGWCGTDQRGEPVCVSSAPAVVTLGDSGSRQIYAAQDNYFGASGFGGAGKGTGAYGVDAPDETAQSQVGYLVGILDKSAAARSTVGGVLSPLNACSVDSSDVAALRTLTQSRTDLLAALDFTPVDKIPGGDGVLAALRQALHLSEEADKGYVDAALIMSGGDCANGRASYRSALAIANEAESAKVAFVDLWNSTIAPQYGVKNFSSAGI